MNVHVCFETQQRRQELTENTCAFALLKCNQLIELATLQFQGAQQKENFNNGKMSLRPHFFPLPTILFSSSITKMKNVCFYLQLNIFLKANIPIPLQVSFCQGFLVGSYIDCVNSLRHTSTDHQQNFYFYSLFEMSP